MTRRAKRLRRLVLLSAAIATVGAAATFVTHRRSVKREADLQTLRAEGLAAYEAGDFVTTIQKLDRYAASHDDDAAALLPLAIARSKVPATDDGHVRASIRTLTRVLELDPHNATARGTLLELLPKTDDADWMDRLATDALSVDPNDVVALRARLTAKLRQQRFDDALATAQSLAKINPDDLDAHVQVLRLMSRLNRPAGEAVAYAAIQFIPGDPRQTLLRAIADTTSGNNNAAMVNMRLLAELQPNDPTLIRHAVSVYDGIGRYGEAVEFLAGGVDRTNDAGLNKLLAMRLWQRGEDTRLVALPGTDTEVLGLRAAALIRLNRKDEATSLISRIAGRPDRASAAWALALPAVAAPVTGPPTALLQAIAKDPTNAVIRVWLAGQYATLGEPALALPHSTAATQLEPIWSAPHAGLAAALVAIGREAEAATAAQAAYDRAPTLAAAIDLITVRFAAYEVTTDPNAARDLLAAIASVQAAWPMEPRTLAIRVTLLCRMGRRSEAATIVDTAADHHSALETIAREEGLAVSFADIRQASLKQSTPNNSDKLAAPTPAAPRSTEQLRALTGDAGQQWRLERARSLMNSPDTAKLNEAVALLSDLIRETPQMFAFRLELANALERTGNIASAIDHLNLAVASAPRSALPVARLVPLLRRQGRDKDATELLKKVAMSVSSPLRLRLTVAALAIDGGNESIALTALERPAQVLPASGRLMVATALASLGRVDEAKAAFTALVSDPRATPEALTTTAEFFARQGESDACRPLLDRLPTAGASPEETAIARARFETKHGDLISAREQLQPMLKTPVGRSASRALATNDARSISDAAKLLADADAAMPADAWPEQAAAVSAWAATARRFDDKSALVKAVELADAYLAKQPDDVDTRLLQAGLLTQIGKSTEAEAALRKVLAARPDSAAANNDLAWLLLDRPDDLPEAERLSRRAVEDAPGVGTFHDTLARVLARTGRPAEARRAFDTAVKLDPKLRPAAKDWQSWMRGDERNTPRS